MTNSSRFLITTEDENTWKFDCPVIFLGDWCKDYDRKKIWQDMDTITAEPYGLGLTKKDSDYAKAKLLEAKLLPMLINLINDYHGLENSERFWSIVLGQWLRRYVILMINRVETLKQCLKTYQILGASFYDCNNYFLSTDNSRSAMWSFSDGQWNNVLNSHILDLLNIGNFPIEIIKKNKSSSFSESPPLQELIYHSVIRKIFKWGYQKLSKFLWLLVKNDDAFIISSYLPKKELIKLQLALGQFPQFWSRPKIILVEKHNREIRAKLTKKILRKSGSDLEDIIFAMVFELLPICYLEGFDTLNKHVKQQPWPKNPKFIYTCNNFDNDEVFKLWAATKVELGALYVVGQHGNNYGTSRYLNPSVEELTADKFLTWGWVDGLSQHVPAFIFKNASREAKRITPVSGLLLVELCLNEDRLRTWDGIYEFGSYFKEQQIFINELVSPIRSQLTIRLNSAHKLKSWSEEARWNDFDPSIKINGGFDPVSHIISQSRLTVFSYDSTGILESLSQNIPTLVFWQNGFDHLRESAKPFYQILLDVEILHLTPESAAQKVSEVWDNIDDWWNQPKVQDARKIFCNNYARISKNPAIEIKELLS